MCRCQTDDSAGHARPEAVRYGGGAKQRPSKGQAAAKTLPSMPSFPPWHFSSACKSTGTAFHPGLETLWGQETASRIFPCIPRTQTKSVRGELRGVDTLSATNCPIFVALEIADKQTKPEYSSGRASLKCSHCNPCYCFRPLRFDLCKPSRLLYTTTNPCTSKGKERQSTFGVPFQPALSIGTPAAQPRLNIHI